MIDLIKGTVKFSDGLTIVPGFLFEQFKKTRFYNNQDGVKIIDLDEQQLISGRKYIVSLFFRNGKIYIVSFVCCDQEFSEQNEKNRKELHDRILNEWGINPNMEYNWGKIESDYDVKSNLSSIDMIYF